MRAQGISILVGIAMLASAGIASAEPCVEARDAAGTLASDLAEVGTLHATEVRAFLDGIVSDGRLTEADAQAIVQLIRSRNGAMTVQAYLEFSGMRMRLRTDRDLAEYRHDPQIHTSFPADAILRDDCRVGGDLLWLLQEVDVMHLPYEAP